MDFLKAEIEKRKRKQNEIPIVEDAVPTKKYIKRGELDKVTDKKYFEELEQERKRKEEIKKKELEEQEKQQQQFDALTKKKPQQSEEDTLQVYLKDPEEVIKRLRARGEVVIFFGETEEERAKRLQKLEELEPMELLGGTSDEFGKQLRKVDAEQQDDKPIQPEKPYNEEKKKKKFLKNLFHKQQQEKYIF